MKTYPEGKTITFVACAVHKKTGTIENTATFTTEERAKKYVEDKRIHCTSHDHFVYYPVPEDWEWN